MMGKIKDCCRIWVVVLVLGVAGGVLGMTAGTAVGQERDFAVWLDGLKREAAAKGISQRTLDAALSGINPIPRVIELDRRQPEFTMTFDQYLNRVVPRSRVQRGKSRLRENRELLEKIGKKYRVQPRFIVALWGIETDFGRIGGGFSVIRSLATLAFDGRRSSFFRGELLRALKILDEGHIDVENMKGSWAGAMGQFQFMPSTFVSFAVDHDGDGQRDIWTNKADAFASAANYLSRSGWRNDQTWGRRVTLPQGFDDRLVGLKVTKSISQWQALGVRRAGGGDLPSRDLVASIVRAGKKDGPAFMVYQNYRVTLKWNRSTFFAVAVGTLAERIGDG